MTYQASCTVVVGFSRALSCERGPFTEGHNLNKQSLKENAISTRNFYVLMSIVHVPTSVNKQGIGIDQFVMK